MSTAKRNTAPEVQRINKIGSQVLIQGFTAVLLCVFCLQGHAQRPPSAEDTPTIEQPAIRVAITVSPYSYVDSEGNISGVVAELAQASLRLMGRDVHIILMPYLRAVHAIKAGEIDLMYGLHVDGSSTQLPLGVVTSIEPQTILPLSLYALPDSDIQVNNWLQTHDHRIGSVRLVRTDQRTTHQGQGNTYYYKNADSLSKALLAKRIDLATLEPGSAWAIGRSLGIQLRSVFVYSKMQSYPVFSPSSPRLGNPMIFCQAFIRARTALFDAGEYQRIVKDNGMEFLLEYYIYTETAAQQCRLTQ